MKINYIPYESEPLDSENLSASSKHEGQSLAGEGGIDDYFAYMLDRYGGSYVITDVRYLKSDFDYVRQTAYSIYNVKNSDGSISGEGNCTLSSVYALMNYLESSGTCASLPASSMFTTHKASEDSFYSKYCNDPDYSIKETITLPFLYYQIRRSAIVNYGYQVGGFFSGYNAQLIDSVAKMNSAGVDATLHTLGSFDLCVKPQIQKDKPVMFSVDLSETYGSHSLVVTGYHVYTKTTTILGINFKDYVYLLRVNDNWKAAPRYFDLTAFNGTWSYTTVEVTK